MKITFSKTTGQAMFMWTVPRFHFYIMNLTAIYLCCIIQSWRQFKVRILIWLYCMMEINLWLRRMKFTYQWEEWMHHRIMNGFIIMNSFFTLQVMYWEGLFWLFLWLLWSKPRVTLLFNFQIPLCFYSMQESWLIIIILPYCTL